MGSPHKPWGICLRGHFIPLPLHSVVLWSTSGFSIVENKWKALGAAFLARWLDRGARLWHSDRGKRSVELRKIRWTMIDSDMGELAGVVSCMVLRGD